LYKLRVINPWNDFPNDVVTSHINSFKNRSDKFWTDEETHFVYKAKLTGTGIAPF